MPAPPPQAGGTGSAPSVTFTNPVIRGFNPDPTICVVPADADTGQPATYFLSTSTFEFFPGCAIHASTDLLNWRLIGHALTRRSQIDLRTVEPGAGSWASTLRYRPREKRWYLANGLFHRYRPAVDERIFPRGFYVYTDNIWDDNAWSDPVYFDNPGFDQDVSKSLPPQHLHAPMNTQPQTHTNTSLTLAPPPNKQQLFWDDATSKVYLSTTMRLAARPAGSRLKDFAIHISEIDLPTGRTLTPPAPIRESPHGIAEGSHIVRRGRFYYLFTAEGGTEAGHQEWVLRSDRGPLGPWEARAGAGGGGPLWYNGPGEEVQRTGHADVFEDGEGRWWAVLLGVRPVWDAARGRFLEPQLGRETFLVKVDWVDDWPVFNEGKNITLETRGRDAVQAQRYARDDGLVWEADLSKTELELGWYQKNTPIKQTYSLTERPGHLRLYGTCFDLSSPEAPAMLLRKQASYSDAFHARMQFGPSKAGYEAGLVLWWSCFSYAAIGITRVELHDGSEELQVVARRPTGVAGKVDSFNPLLGSDGGSNQALLRDQVSLAVECFEAGYRLSLQSGTAVASFEIHVEDLTVMPPVGGAFTGVMYGLYAMGNGEPVLDPADFIGLKVTDLSVKQ